LCRPAGVATGTVTCSGYGRSIAYNPDTESKTSIGFETRFLEGGDPLCEEALVGTGVSLHYRRAGESTFSVAHANSTTGSANGGG
jgi:hypothetical protein